MIEMTEQEMLEAQKRADAIVDKVRNLVALESQLLEAREAATDHTAHQNGLKELETELETRVEELSGIADELKWATPLFQGLRPAPNRRHSGESKIFSFSRTEGPRECHRGTHSRRECRTL